MIGMEGGHSIDNSLATLRMMHALGAGYMTLTHSANVPWADSATDKPVLGGLSKFGEEVVREMNWLGMLVDLSHVSPDTMEDAIRVSEAPVIFSHSSAKAVCNVPRNVPDNVLQMLPKNGGVVMITFVPGFISQEVADYGHEGHRRSSSRSARSSRTTKPTSTAGDGALARREPGAARHAVAGGRSHRSHPQGRRHRSHRPRRRLRRHHRPSSRVSRMCRSIPTSPRSCCKRGYTDQDIKKILGLNILRVMREAERVSAELRKKRGPSTATIEAAGSGRHAVVTARSARAGRARSVGVGRLGRSVGRGCAGLCDVDSTPATRPISDPTYQPDPTDLTPTDQPYSARSAIIGSTVVARQAGPRHASAPATRNAVATTTNVSGSVGVVLIQVGLAARARSAIARADADHESDADEHQPLAEAPCRARCCCVAPSAIRRPNSCVRCDTDCAITPVMPVTVTSSASAANTVSSIAVSRGVASERSRISSSVRTFSIGRSGSTPCTASRMSAVACDGSPVTRTSTRPASPPDCRSGT